MIQEVTISKTWNFTLVLWSFRFWRNCI